MKKLLTATLVLIMVLVSLPGATFANDDIRVTVNGQAVAFPDQSPVIVDGRTLVPVRATFEAMGFGIGWNPNTRTATLTRTGYVVNITIDSATFTTNGVTHTLDVPAQIIGGSTMLPIRAVLESVGYELQWENSTRTVVITSGTNVVVALPAPVPDNEPTPVPTPQPATPSAGNIHRDENMNVVTPLSEIDSFAVFWGHTGNRYHINPECRTILNGVLFGTLDEAREVGRDGWCGICSSHMTYAGFNQSGRQYVSAPATTPQPEPTPEPEPTPAPTPQSNSGVDLNRTVWTAATGGTIYHSVNNCGNMNPNRATSMTRQQARNRGARACRRCW